MKKGLLAVLLGLAVLVLASCGSNVTNPSSESGTTNIEGKFSVGFSRVDIRPTEPLPMAGYGNTTSRMSAGSLDYLYAQVIACTDEEGETILICVYDLIKVGDTMRDYIVQSIEKELGIPDDHIFFNSSHTHSAPDQTVTSLYGIQRYVNQQLPAWTLKAAKQAMADRAPATIYTGDTVAKGMNFVRHYVTNDGTYAGDNFGSFTSGAKDYITKADQFMQFLSFRRENKPEILCVNWQCHSQMLGRENLDVSADFIGVLRNEVEEKLDNVKCVYLQGAAGNINGHSSRVEDNLAPRDYKLFGQKLAPFVTEAYGTLTETPSGKIQVWKDTLVADSDHSEDHMLADAKAVVEYSLEHFADVSATTAFARAHGFNSYYHASGVVSKASRGKTANLFLGAFSIGDMGFGLCGSEMFDEQGMYIRDNSPFSRTFVLAYSQDHQGYLPNRFAYEMNCYEVNITPYAAGTAETAAEDIVAALKTLKSNLK